MFSKNLIIAVFVTLCLSGCAPPIAMVFTIGDQKPADFDEALSFHGAGCDIANAPFYTEPEEYRRMYRQNPPCSPQRALGEYFAQKSQDKALSEYFSENHVKCIKNKGKYICSFERYFSVVPYVNGAPLHKGGKDVYKLKIDFPLEDNDLKPEQVFVDLKRFTYKNE